MTNRIKSRLSLFLGKIFGHRCTGHCCRDFYLPFPPEELQKSYQRLKGELQDGGPIYQDVEIVAPIFKFLYKTDDGKHRYTCSQLMKDGNCGIYKSRPRVCSEYPYGGKCNYADCTWDKNGGNALLKKTVFGCKKLLKLEKEKTIQTIKTKDGVDTVKWIDRNKKEKGE